MKPRVYIETSVIGYLTSRPSRDIVTAGHQQITHEWWLRRERFDLFVSELVVREASDGDPRAAAERLLMLENLPQIPLNDEARELARTLGRGFAVPMGSETDAAHVAVATVHRMDFLLTWNCKHIANAFAVPKMAVLCQAAGWTMPTICTPEQFNNAAT
jgi:hypothetical protein